MISHLFHLIGRSGGGKTTLHRCEPTRRHARSHVGGFSLIEVLIAVLVLAVGLLGLGAVFPAVIAQQRAATESGETTRAVRFAELQLLESGLVDIDQMIVDDSIPQTVNTTGMEDYYRWVPLSAAQGEWTTFDAQTGLLQLPFDGANSNANISRTRRQIPVRARLYPELFSNSPPRFVWDAMTHRNRATDNVEVAIFVRRINGSIRVPDGWTLSNLLVGLSPTGDVVDPVLPVVLDEDNPDRLVRPDGTDDIYAEPKGLRIEVEEPADRRDQDSAIMRVRTAANAIDDALALRYFFKPGQLFVDDFGVVRRVVEVDKAQREITVDPPFRGIELEAESVLYTPDIPVRIKVIAVEGGGQ